MKKSSLGKNGLSSANMEGVASMSYTAARHKGVIKIILTFGELSCHPPLFYSERLEINESTFLLAGLKTALFKSTAL